MSLKVTRCRIRQDNTVCQVVLIESARPPDRQVRSCVGVRPVVAPAAPAPRDTLRRRTHLPGGRADLIHTTTTTSVNQFIVIWQLEGWITQSDG